MKFVTDLHKYTSNYFVKMFVTIVKCRSVIASIVKVIFDIFKAHTCFFFK